MLTKHTAPKIKNQEPNKSSLLGQQCAVGNINSVIAENPYKYFNDKTDGCKRVLGALIACQYEFGSVFQMSSKELGARAGLQGNTVDRYLKDLAKDNVVSTTFNRHEGKILTVNDYLSRTDVRESLRPLFKRFTSLGSCLLVSMLRSVHSQDLQKEIKVSLQGMIFISPNTDNILDARARLSEYISPITGVIFKDLNRATLDFKNAKLALEEKITLQAFPEEVVRWADEEIGAAKRVKNAFGWIFTKCAKWCKARKIGPLWARVMKLRKRYGVNGFKKVTFDVESIKQQAEELRDAFGPTKYPEVYTQPAKQNYKGGYTRQNAPERPRGPATQNYLDYQSGKRSEESKRLLASRTPFQVKDTFEDIVRAGPKHPAYWGVEGFKKAFPEEFERKFGALTVDHGMK